MGSGTWLTVAAFAVLRRLLMGLVGGKQLTMC